LPKPRLVRLEDVDLQIADARSTAAAGSVRTFLVHDGGVAGAAREREEVRLLLLEGPRVDLRENPVVGVLDKPCGRICLLTDDLVARRARNARARVLIPFWTRVFTFMTIGTMIRVSRSTPRLASVPPVP